MARQPNARSQSTPGSARSGAKKRTPTSTSHKGSRVEPSHVNEQKRTTREKRTNQER
jgi:hypothetical protein